MRDGKRFRVVTLVAREPGLTALRGLPISPGPLGICAIYTHRRELRLADPARGERPEYPRYVELAYRTSVLPVNGAHGLLRWSRAQGLARALVTSTPRGVVEGVLAKLGWPDCFEVIACGDEVADAKPDPAIYARACEVGGWEPDECVAVEDAPAGVRAAAACGMAVIGVGPAERLEALRACGAAWTCETLKHVRDILHTQKTQYGFNTRC